MSTREGKRVTAVTLATFVHIIQDVKHEMKINLALRYDHVTTIVPH